MNILETKSLTVKYNQHTALEDFDFKIESGEIVGLLGDNGAGKSTFIHSVLGLCENMRGEVLWNGKNLKQLNPQNVRSNGAEVVFQDLRIFDELNIVQNIFLNREINKKNKILPVKDEDTMLNVVREQLAQFGITAERFFKMPIKELPGGIQQIVAFMRAYIFAGKIIILDEPIKGLDEHSIEIVLRLIKRLASRGVAVIFVTHKAHEVFNIADRFVILKNGKCYRKIEKRNTTLKEVEQILVYSRLNLIQELTASVSHQLKNPLGVLKLCAGMLQEDFNIFDDNDDYREIVSMLQNEVNKIDHVVSNLLRYTQNPTIDKHDNDISITLNSVLKELNMKNHNKKISVDCKLDDTVYNYDAGIIKQILENIISNAIEASAGDGDEVKVLLEKENDKLHIAVKDHGPGIDVRDVNKIFNPYFTTKINGTGLGLTIVERLIEMHGDSIKIDSGHGAGTTVHIYL